MSDETKDKHAFGSWTLGGLEYAKLTRAAPDLLAALELCVEAYEDEIKKTDAWQRMHLGYVDRESTPSHIMHARAAIDKARNGA